LNTISHSIDTADKKSAPYSWISWVPSYYSSSKKVAAAKFSESLATSDNEGGNSSAEDMSSHGSEDIPRSSSPENMLRKSSWPHLGGSRPNSGLAILSFDASVSPSSAESGEAPVSNCAEKLDRKSSWPHWGGSKPSQAANQSSSSSTLPTSPIMEKGASAQSIAVLARQNSIIMGKSEDFRKKFGFPETENLICSYSCYLHRVLLRIGRIYISENYISFNSKLYGIRTKVVIPISNILQINREKNTKFLFYGVTIVTKDLVRIPFEFVYNYACNKCYHSLCEMVNVVDDTNVDRGIKSPIQVLEDLRLGDIHSQNASQTDLDYSSNIATPKPMHITCLTIGTRGDVQVMFIYLTSSHTLLFVED
jgi:hypothetical protein